MIINDPDAFKSWLTAILEPLCDADPGALAKYVYALCKKDRSESELREAMLDQLDVFLQSGTKAFVAKLMKTLETQVYELPSDELKTDDEPPKKATTGLSTAAVEGKTLEAATPPREASPASPTPTNQDKAAASQAPKVPVNKVVNKSAAVAQPRKDTLQHSINLTVAKKDKDDKVKEKDITVPTVELYNGSNVRKERETRKSDSDRDERRRHRTRTRSRSRSWERSRRSRSRDRRERDKSRQWRNKSPPNIGATGHAPPSRRYRPSPPPRGSRLPGSRSGGNRYRNRSPSPLPRSRHSKPRDDRTTRSRTRSRSRSRTTDRDMLSGPATPTQDSNHGEPDLRLGSTAQSIQSVVPNLKSLSQRCRDYDEKGYCMKGDLCPYDHGVDPVILQDVNLPGVLAGFGPGTGSERPVPVAGALPPPPAQGPMLSRIAPSRHSEYNPDAPAMWHPNQQRNMPPAPQPPFIRQGGPRYANHGPQGHPPHVFGGPAPPFPYGGGPRGPIHNQQPMRELIAVPVVDDINRAGGEGGGNRGPKRAVEAEAIESMPKRKGHFDFNRLGPARGAIRPSSSLELKKVPRGLNSIEHLNNHFSKFGKIVNIQVSYEGDPEGAIVTFSTHAEANAAYRSTEAVLNNRFIKVFWHNPENKTDQTMTMQPFHPVHGTTHNRQMIKDNTGGGAVGQPNSPFAAAATVKDANTAATASAGGASCPPTTHPTANRGEAGGAPATDAKAQAISAIQKGQAALAAQHALRKKKEESRKEALEIVKGLSKRKQDLLQGQLKQQRLLIERLEKAENQAQKETLMSTIKTVQESIERLQAEIKAAQETVQVQSANATAPGANLTAKNAVKPVRLTREQAQKEILDAELEIFTKQQAGADISALQRKVIELRAQVPFLRGSFSRGRGAYRGGAKGTLGRPHHVTSVDRRPTKLLVTGFNKDEADQVVEHLKKFGEIAEHLVEPTTPAMSVRFVARAHAEQALLRGKQFNEKMLSMTWISESNKPNKGKSTKSESISENKLTIETSIEKTEDNQEMSDTTLDIEDSFLSELAAGNDLEMQGGESDNEQMKYIAFEESLLQEEEEEDEETEDRSWRR